MDSVLQNNTRIRPLSLRDLRRFNHILPDIVIFCVAFYLSLLLRLGYEDVAAYNEWVLSLLPVFIMTRLFTFTYLGVYEIIWRYFSFRDGILLAKAIFLSTAFTVSLTYFIDLGRVPRSTFVIEACLLCLFLGGVRLLRRYLHEKRELGTKRTKAERRVAIFGGGENGRLLFQHLKADPSVEVVGFIDDCRSKVGRKINGCPVLGDRSAILNIVRRLKVDEVFVAVESSNPELLSDLVAICKKANIRPKLFRKSNAANTRIKRVRDFELSDLLDRENKSIDLSDLKRIVANQVVLVTGAGGSIGSELARQISSLGPSQLLLLDNSEYSLYKIEQTLADDGSLAAERVHPLLISIVDISSLREIFETHKPNIVFHAAAYKHVHLVEKNPNASILNNILGTKNLIDLSDQFDVSTFIQISTDKAVNPAGVMGATKRICELLVTRAGRHQGRRFASVRFGNVLGSSGSLIPKLKEQILNETPITITHREMRRYFMLIPEAVALVLKAATVAQPGDVMVLRMGKPIPIIDIAKSLLSLMGKTQEEVPIIFTGTRPGEKLCEELYLTGDERPTTITDILTIPDGDCPQTDFDWFDVRLERLIEAAQASDPQTRKLLFELIALGNGHKAELFDSVATQPIQLEGLNPISH